MSEPREAPDYQTVPEHLLRYASLVDDVDAFLAAATRPLPKVVWANPLKGDPDAALAQVRAAFPTATSVGWRAHTLRLPPDAKPGRLPAFLLGQLHGQEEAALWPGDLLAPLPGMSVLDLCAAPGGKAALAAVAMGDRGHLLANEWRYARLASLRRTFNRLGITCAAVSCGDGTRLKGRDGGFDRVMVDVPCTCEGTTRKAPSRREATDEHYRASVCQVQRALLRHAVRLCRPGGRLVYATCTYAPEENEAAIDALGPEVVVEPITAPAGLKVAPGICTWNGQRFRPDVVNAARIWPHHNDTGGFFVAVLRKL